MMRWGILGSGSWATALAKLLTDNGQSINWWIRNEESIAYLKKRKHNPHYLTSVYFDTNLISMNSDVAAIAAASDILLVAVPSAYVLETLQKIPKEELRTKKLLSAVKGILPEQNILLNHFLVKEWQFDAANYYTVMGPCHAEEVAAEKLSYLTFSGQSASDTADIAACFHTPYLNTVVNADVCGVQYAAVLKNIYALGAGIAHGLEYGDNFLSVFIANCADEMAGFLRTVQKAEQPDCDKQNYSASVYLGDLLVTCYSLFSRNRTFGNMIGKGYSVKAAQLEMNMVAEGFNASKCIYNINQQVQYPMPIASTIYQILWKGLKPSEGFKMIEEKLK